MLPFAEPADTVDELRRSHSIPRVRHDIRAWLNVIRILALCMGCWLLAGCSQQAEDPAASTTSPPLPSATANVLQLTGATSEQLSALPQPEEVRHLQLISPKIEGEQWQVLTTFRHLAELRAGQGAADDTLMQVLAAMPQLERLNLPNAEFTDQGLAALAALPKLELLRFGSKHVTDDGLRSVARLSTLRFLHIMDTPITDRGLMHLHELKQLESLYLDGTRVTDEGIGQLLKALPAVHLHIDQQHDDRDPQRHEH